MDLPFFLGLMNHLANKGFPCPTPLHGFDGKALRTLCNKPAALITFVTGSGPKIITRDHCYSVGKIAGKMHTAAKDFQMGRNNTLDRLGWRKIFELTKKNWPINVAVEPKAIKTKEKLNTVAGRVLNK